MDVTRRTLAHMLAAAAAVPVVAAPQAPSSDDSKTAHEQMLNTTQQLAKVSLPIGTEPAFHFKA
jgi:hypothetical protein